MACFALVSGIATPSVSATLAGSALLATFICSASPAGAEAVTWDANWNATAAPTEIPDDHVLSEIPSDFTFLSSSSEDYLVDGQTVVRLAGTAVDATEVNVIGGAGATTGSTSESEGLLTADTWLKVTGGTYETIVGGSYAQNYDGGVAADFTGDSHILLTSQGGSSATVDYIIGGNYMEGQNATFTGNTYISVEEGTVNGSIVGAGTSGHNQTSNFVGNTHVWVYTPLSGTADSRFNLPGNLIIGGSAGMANGSPKVVVEGNTNVNIELSTYTPGGSAASMEKAIIGDAWLQNNSTSTHSGNVVVDIKGTDANGDNVSFSQPVVAGSWLAGSGSTSLSGTTTLSISGGSFSEDVVGGSWFAAGDGVASSTSGDISLTISGGEFNGSIYGGSHILNSNAQSSASHGNISLSLTGGSINGNVFAGGSVGAVVNVRAEALSSVTAASTQVEISNDVTLGSTGAGITISGGVENANAASGVTGDRALLLSESSYDNLANVTFSDFNIVSTAADVTLKLRESDESFTKTGAGTLSIDGANSNLDTIGNLTVEQGRFDSGTAWLTRGQQGLSAITLGEGASLVTDGLALADGAALSFNVSNAAADSLITVDGGLSVGGAQTLTLTLLGTDALAVGSSVTLLSWNSPSSPFALSGVNWVNKGEGMDAYTLSLVDNALVLSRAADLDWNGGSGTWSNVESEWDSQGGTSSNGRTVSFNTPEGNAATVTISGAVAPMDIIVDNAAGSTYTFASDGTGSITGTASLTKENDGMLRMELANTYTGGTVINAGTVDAAALSALGTGAVTVNAGGSLMASAQDALAGNAVVLNGGTLSYTAGETRNLDAAGITHAAGNVPQLSVASGSTVTWQYTAGTALEAAIAEGLELSGGGTLVANAADSTATVALTGPLSLKEAGTTLELGSAGVKTLGAVGAPMDIKLEAGTTLRVQQPEAAAPTTIHAELAGEGTLEFAASNAVANNTVQLTGDNADFAGAVNLGAAPSDSAAVVPTPLAVDGPAILLDYSQGSPVGATLNLNGMSFATVLPGGTTTTTAANVNLNANTTQYGQTAGLDNTFSGTVSGASGLTWMLDSTLVDGGQVNTLTGDLSGMQGALGAMGKEGSIAGWVLGDGTAALSPTIAASLSAGNEFNQYTINDAGDITLSGSVSGLANVTKQGAGKLTLTAPDASMGTLRLEEGSVEFSGGTATAETLEDTANGGTIGIAQGSTLATTGTSTLESARLEGPGTLRVEGTLSMEDAARLNGVALELAQGAILGLDATTGHSVSALNGRGTINGTGTADTVGLSVTGTGGSFGGALTGNGTLSIEQGGTQQLSNTFLGSSGWSLVNDGRMGLDFVQADGSNASLSFDDVTLGADSVTDVRVNTSSPVANLLTLGSLTMEQGAKVNLSTSAGSGRIINANTRTIIGSVSDGQAAGTLGTITPDTRQTAFMLLDARRSTLSVDENGNLVLNLVTSNRNTLAPLADNTNSAAAAGMLWGAAYSGNATAGTDIRRLLDALNGSRSVADANRILASASGASATVLSAAFASDVERQLRAIRNRSIITPGAARRVACKGAHAADGPHFGAWINGEGDHRKMDASGYLPGYSLSSWGGTVGMDVTCTGNLVGGLALTALYGDLKARSADHAEGDFDRYYITAFARMKRERWQHTLVGTVGRLDADLDRSVYYGTGSYRTHGSTKGWGYGLMYEIGYDLPMDEDAHFTLQPIVNVAWRYVDVGSYTENGSDAALRVGSQDYHVVTFGAGLRSQAEVGERWFNRRAMLEGRALVKVDAGDRHGSARVAMLGGGASEKVRSEKLGAVGVELGAGLSIPLGDGHSSVFIDGTAELRSEYSNLNGTIGYRFEF